MFVGARANENMSQVRGEYFFSPRWIFPQNELIG